MQRLIALASVLVLLVIPPAASAHYDTPPLHWHRGGPDVHYSVYVNVPDKKFLKRTEAALDDWAAHTLISVDRVGSPTGADVTLEMLELGPSVAGQTSLFYVTEADGSKHLVRAEIQLDLDMATAAPHLQQRVVAHELGHAFGDLAHHDCQACGGVMLNGGSEYVTSAHDRADINDFYLHHLDGAAQLTQRSGPVRVKKVH